MQRLIRLAIIMVTVLILVLTVNLGMASAHNPDEPADDTPNLARFNGQEDEPALDNYEDALGHSEAGNSTIRNPTCGAHDGPNGIHPPGNP